MEQDEVCWVGKELEGRCGPTFFACSPESIAHLCSVQGTLSAS